MNTPRGMSAGEDIGTIISLDQMYRYALTRRWSVGPRLLMWVMLNPSTADEMQNDPTVRRCIGFSKAWGFDGLMVGNLYAYRATVPKHLWVIPDPVGAENDHWLHELAARANSIVCAWGKPGPLPERARIVRAILESHLGVVTYLTMNKTGHPGHPLYLPGALQLQRWSAA